MKNTMSMGCRMADETRFYGTVTGIISDRINPVDKTVKVRIPQFHGLPGNPTEYKAESYVEDEDLPSAVIVSPIGMSFNTLDTLLTEGTVVYVQFSDGKVAYPIITGWVAGSEQSGSTRYKAPANISGYNATSSRHTYSGNTYNKLVGSPGTDTPTSGFAYPFEGATLNWPFAPYDPFNNGYQVRHGGIDLGGVPGGYPIYSICDSTVQFKYILDSSMGNSIWALGYDSGGNRIQIQYMHMDNFAEGIAIGDTLHKGDLVGYIGTTGSSTGVHLHLGIRYIDGINGQHINEYRDPARVMGITDWQSPYEWYYDQPGY